MALDATFRLAGPEGSRDVTARDFFRDLYVTALAENELLQHVRIAPPPTAHRGTAFGKYAARQAMDYSSTVSAAVSLARDPADGSISDIGLGLGGCGTIPVWPQRTEAALRGRRPDAEAFAVMREVLAEEIAPIGDMLYSADYKRRVAAVILERTITTAYRRAGGGAADP